MRKYAKVQIIHKHLDYSIYKNQFTHPLLKKIKVLEREVSRWFRIENHFPANMIEENRKTSQFYFSLVSITLSIRIRYRKLPKISTSFRNFSKIVIKLLRGGSTRLIITWVQQRQHHRAQESARERMLSLLLSKKLEVNYWKLLN